MKRGRYSKNAKDIRTLNRKLAIVAGLIGTLVLLMLILKLGRGCEMWLSNQTYNILITAHGFVMILYMIMPELLGGFGKGYMLIIGGALGGNTIKEEDRGGGYNRTGGEESSEEESSEEEREGMKRILIDFIIRKRREVFESNFGKVVLRNDEEVIPEWWRNLKNKYIFGIGKLIFISAIARWGARYLMSLEHESLLRDGGIVVLFVILMIMNIVHILDFFVSVSYMLWKYLKKIGLIERIYYYWGRVLGKTSVESMRATGRMLNAPMGPGGGKSGVDWVNVGRLGWKGVKAAGGVGGTGVAIYTIGEMYDIHKGGGAFKYGTLKQSYKLGVYETMPNVVPILNTEEGKRLVNIYGKDMAIILMDKTIQNNIRLGHGGIGTLDVERRKMLTRLAIERGMENKIKVKPGVEIPKDLIPGGQKGLPGAKLPQSQLPPIFRAK